jgi:hypothetical protein
MTRQQALLEAFYAAGAVALVLIVSACLLGA